MNTSVEAIYSLGLSHNSFSLPLPDGTTYPDYWPAKDTRPIEFLAHFDRVRDKDWADCLFLDLACSEGATTFGLSQTGGTVFGVEGRADGILRANVLRDIVGFDRTHFSVGNVNREESFRKVDGIFNAGILYHLEDPISFLERCAHNARLFMYVDAAHRPRSEDERREARHAPSMGRTYQIEWHGLKIDAMDFAEPNVVAEKADGVRRKPRSGIGNTTSVWLAQHSLVDIMAELGFPYHETVADMPLLSRMRTCFFRRPPRPLGELGPLAKPLPRVEARGKAILNARRRDIAYLQRQGRPVLVVGHDPILKPVLDDLLANGIQVGGSVKIPERFKVKTIGSLLASRSERLVVAAVPDVRKIIEYLMLLDRFEYAFASFAMACNLGKVA